MRYMITTTPHYIGRVATDTGLTEDGFKVFRTVDDGDMFLVADGEYVPWSRWQAVKASARRHRVSSVLFKGLFVGLGLVAAVLSSEALANLGWTDTPNTEVRRVVDDRGGLDYSRGGWSLNGERLPIACEDEDTCAVQWMYRTGEGQWVLFVFKH